MRSILMRLLVSAAHYGAMVGRVPALRNPQRLALPQESVVRARSLWGTAAVVLWLIVAVPSPAGAQFAPVLWGEPTNISDSPESSLDPVVVCDAYGNVHVLWCEALGGPPMRSEDTARPGNAIMHRRWNGTTWTEPTNVLYVPGDGLTAFVAAHVGDDQSLHVVWTGMSRIYYASAPAAQADSAHAWSKPVVVAGESARSRYETDITSDARGILYVAYATRGLSAGVHCARSLDQGLTWQTVATISGPLRDLEESYSNVRLVATQDGALHATWATNNASGYPQAAYYARGMGRGESWSEPLLLGVREEGEFGAGWPVLANTSDSELHLVYLDGGTSGRAHRLSFDGGEKWSAPQRIVQEMEGLNGYVIPIADGADQLHLIVNMRTRDHMKVGIYHSSWSGNAWAPAIPVDVSSRGAPSAHKASAALRLGNELHVAYTQLRGGEIWHISGKVAGVEPDDALRTPLDQRQVPTPPVSAASATTVPTAQARTYPRDYEADPADSDSTPRPGAYGVVGAFLVVGGVLWRELSRHYRT